MDAGNETSKTTLTTWSGNLFLFPKDLKISSSRRKSFLEKFEKLMEPLFILNHVEFRHGVTLS